MSLKGSTKDTKHGVFSFGNPAKPQAEGVHQWHYVTYS